MRKNESIATVYIDAMVLTPLLLNSRRERGFLSTLWPNNMRMRARYVIFAALLAVLLLNSVEGAGRRTQARIFDQFARLIVKQIEGLFDKQSEQVDEAFGEESWSSGCQGTEVYDECGSSCPHVCGEPVTQQCSQECVVGCVCRPGYILGPAGGGCIPEAQCNQWLSTRG
ncbi:mucin-19-like isoform X1 [Rhipicephalus microplus]|uniref:mucin-19-like isoform X1 n=1 Tax=Rhipicephalus microplus TaxID=6941 RepID=UPI003F6CC3B6